MKFLALILALIWFGCSPIYASKECVRKWFDKDNSFVCVCNETYCDLLIDVDVIKKGELIVLQSDKHQDRFKRYNYQFKQSYYESKDLACDDSVTGCNLTQTIRVNQSETFQTILGFGAAFTDATGFNLKKLSKTLQGYIIYDYFGGLGLKYSMARVPIGGSDFSTRPYSYDDVAEEDFDLKKFQLAKEDFEYKIPFIRMGKNYSPYDLKLFASPWSPPAWMKSNNKLNGKGGIKGNVTGPYYKSYATYLIKFLKEYQKLGIDFWGLTVQNEPVDGFIDDFAFNCNAMTPEIQRDFIYEVLGPMLNASGWGIEKLKLMIVDDQRPFIEKWADVILSDERAKNFVAGIAFHWYLNTLSPPEVLNRVNDKFPDFFLLSSEACEGSSIFETKKVILGDWKRAEHYAIDIITDLNRFTTGWIDWNMVLDLQGGPNWAKNFVDAPVLISNNSLEYYKQPMFYILAHFTRFLSPGSQRIAFSTDNDHLDVAAFKTPENFIVLIVLNRKNNSIPLRLETKQGLFKETIQSHSIQTLVWYE